MKTKLRGKEAAAIDFNKVMSLDAFVSDYEFMHQLYRLNMVVDGIKKAVKGK